MYSPLPLPPNPTKSQPVPRNGEENPPPPACTSSSCLPKTQDIAERQAQYLGKADPIPPIPLQHHHANNSKEPNTASSHPSSNNQPPTIPIPISAYPNPHLASLHSQMTGSNS